MSLLKCYFLSFLFFQYFLSSKQTSTNIIIKSPIKKNRKILSILLCLVAVLSFTVGCSKTNAEDKVINISGENTIENKIKYINKISELTRKYNKRYK